MAKQKLLLKSTRNYQPCNEVASQPDTETAETSTVRNEIDGGTSKAAKSTMNRSCTKSRLEQLMKRQQTTDAEMARVADVYTAKATDADTTSLLMTAETSTSQLRSMATIQKLLLNATTKSQS
jgi:hypothetical protein